jgi:hypothetical protein
MDGWMCGWRTESGFLLPISSRQIDESVSIADFFPLPVINGFSDLSYFRTGFRIYDFATELLRSLIDSDAAKRRDHWSPSVQQIEMLIIVIRQLFIGHSTLDGGTHRFRHFIRLDTSSIFKIELFSMCLNFDFVREFVSADRSEKGCAASAASFDIEFIENRRPTSFRS